MFLRLVLCVRPLWCDVCGVGYIMVLLWVRLGDVRTIKQRRGPPRPKVGSKVG